MFKVQGITKRWAINTFSIIVAFVILVVISLSFFVHSLFYGNIEQTLNGRSTELANLFASYTSESSSDFSSDAREYIETFPDKESMELMVLNSVGEPVLTSTGFAPDENQEMPDFKMAEESLSGHAIWSGKLISGEKVMSVTRTVKNSYGDTLGAIRYIVSLETASSRIFLLISIFIAVGLLIIGLVFISGSYFIRSIVKPVREMSDVANRISEGDFDARIDKMYDDEIGLLCDSINNMALEIQNAEQMKNDFISRVSHELRTPLTAIKGWAETMQAGGITDQETFDKGMSVIVSETSRLSSIVEELLDFSRLQGNRMVLAEEKLDIIAELDESIYMIREKIFREGKHLLYDEPEETISPIIGDKNRLKQVFINILDNALKYTPEGGVIAIEAKNSDDYKYVNIIFSDNGHGIPKEDLPFIKEKFYKANKIISGSGIGLAVADEIVKLHKGTLNIESSEGVGTTVTIALPSIYFNIDKDDIVMETDVEALDTEAISNETTDSKAIDSETKNLETIDEENSNINIKNSNTKNKDINNNNTSIV